MERALERRPWLLPLVLAALTVVFLRHVLIPPDAGQALNGDDFLRMFYPLHESIRQMVQAGELPLWNPHQMLGHPFIGNPHAALFYPATWLMWLVGTVRGMNLSMVFHTFLGAWGMAVLLRNFLASYVGSLLAGVLYAMSGWAAARFYIGHYNLYVVFAWVPWMMAAYRYALARGTWRSTLPGIAVAGAALLAGHPQMALYGAAGVLTLWVDHIARAEFDLRAAWYATRLLALTGIGAVVLGAALILPAAELTLNSARRSSDLTFANSGAMPPAQLIGLALPDAFGTPFPPDYLPEGTQPYGIYWGAQFYEEMLAYVGLLPLLALPLIFRLRAANACWYFVGLVALGLVLSVGIDGALWPLLWRWVPGLTAFRVPARGLYFVMIGLAGLAAFLVTALQNTPLEVRRIALRPVLRLWIPGAIASAFAGAVFFSGWYASASHVEPMPSRAWIFSGALAEAGVILAGVWGVLWLWTEPTEKAGRYALLLTCVLVVLDAWHVGAPIITVGSTAEDPMWAGARINIPTGANAAYGRLLGPRGFENLASVTGHLNVMGYDPLQVETYKTLFEAVDQNDPENPVSTLFGVKYFMTTTPTGRLNFKLIGLAPGGIYYERTDAFPRVWVASSILVEANNDVVRQKITESQQDLRQTVFLSQPIDCASGGGGAEITEYRPNDVAIKTNGEGGVLVLSDQYYPGWRAKIDGADTPIYRADTVFRAVCVPPGEHTVRFEYRPLSLYVGAAISAVGWLLVIVALMVFRVPRLGASSKSG